MQSTDAINTSNGSVNWIDWLKLRPSPGLIFHLRAILNRGSIACGGRFLPGSVAWCQSPSRLSQLPTASLNLVLVIIPPIGVRFHPRAPLPPSQRPIPSFVTKHPIYKNAMTQYRIDNNITAQSLINASSNNNPFQAMQTFKHHIREVARVSRDNILMLEHLHDSKDCILTSCSRAYFSNNQSFARMFLNRYSLAREHLNIRSGRVGLISAERFSTSLSRARHDKLATQAQRCETQASQLPPNHPKFKNVGLVLDFWPPS